MEGHILGRELRQLVGLGVNPTKRFHILRRNGGKESRRKGGRELESEPPASWVNAEQVTNLQVLMLGTQVWKMHSLQQEYEITD